LELRSDSLEGIKGKVAFWLGAVAFSASSFVALSITSRFVPEGTVAGISAILALSLVVAVVPGYVQIDRAARASDVRSATASLSVEPSSFEIGYAALALFIAALASVVTARILNLDYVGTFAVALQFFPALKLSSYRGLLMGSESFGALGMSYATEATVRLAVSPALGIPLKEGGFGAGLLLGTLVSLVVTKHLCTRSGNFETAASEPDSRGNRRRSGAIPSLAAGSVAIASALVLANADLLTISARLSPHEADRFAAASIPAKGVFLALFVGGWMFFGRVRRSGDASEAVRLGVITAGCGVVLSACAVAASPLAFFALSKPRESIWLVAVVCMAMALASGTWTLTNLSLSLNGAYTWAPPLFGIGIWALASSSAHTSVDLAVSLLAANYVAFVLASIYTSRLRTTSRPHFEHCSKKKRMGVAKKIRSVASQFAKRVGMDPLLGYVSLVAIAGVCFAQQPGKIVSDTKIDMAIDPLFFLRRAYDMWEPLGYFGHVQNQSYGYLFPMGPYFVAAKYFSLPMWIAQRVWIFGVAATAFTGVCFLAARLGIGTPRTRIAAAGFYVTAPIYASLVAFTSAAVLPGSLLPWMIGALVPRDRRWTPLVGALRSSAAYALAGAVNAAATLAVLPAVAVYLITTKLSAYRAGHNRSRPLSSPKLQLIAATAVLYALASVWWSIPLILLRTYGFNFLQYTESAVAAASTQSLFESMRGSGYWLAYLNLRRPWLPGGWEYVSSPVLVVASGTAVAVGLAGLAFLGARKRLFPAVLFLLGVAASAGPYWFSGAGIFHKAILAMLGGPLGALRNVSKFEFLVTLPLSLGLAHFAPALRVLSIGHSSGQKRVLAALSMVAVGVSILMMTIPAIRGQLATRGGFEAVPQYWLDAARWLNDHSGHDRVAVIPGAPFGEYQWGRPLDEVLQPLSHVPWAVRSLIPLGGTGSTRLLDAVENHLLGQVPSPGLAPALTSAGIRYLVVRNDLDWRASGAPRPLQVKKTLEASGGFVEVAAFGIPEKKDPSSAPQSESTAVDVVEDLGVSQEEANLPKVVVYEVSGSERPVSPVGTVEISDIAIVSGGPESRITLDETKQLRGTPFVLASDEKTLLALEDVAGHISHAVRTDDLRRRDHDYGLVHYNYSYTLGPSERPTGMGAQSGLNEVAEGVSRGGETPREILPPTSDTHKTTRHFEGAASITASSYSSWLVQLPELRPYAAFDGDPRTAWVTGAPGRSKGEWIQIEFDEPKSLQGITITPLLDGPFRPAIRAVKVETDSGSSVSRLEPSEVAQPVQVPPGSTRRLRILLWDVEGEENVGLSGAGIREIHIPGVSVQEVLDVPSDSAAGLEYVVLSRSRLHPSLIGRSDEEPILRRSFSMSSEGTYTIEGLVVPLPGDELDKLIAVRGPVNISASSTMNGLPEFRASNLLDGDTATIWAASLPTVLPNPLGLWEGPKAYTGAQTKPPTYEGIQGRRDPSPSLVLDFGHPITLGELRVVTTTAGPVSPPRSLRIVGEHDVVEGDLVSDGWVRFPPLTTRILRIEFPSIRVRMSVDSMTGIATPLPVGFSDLQIPALGDVKYSVPLPSEEFVLPCGLGPPVVVDGELFDTEVHGKISDLIFMRPFSFRACRSWVVQDNGRSHRIEETEGSRPFALSQVRVVRIDREPPDQWSKRRDFHEVSAKAELLSRREVSVEEWGPRKRRLWIEPGPERILYINENANIGWKANLGSFELKQVTLDGWKQGFLLPEGVGGEVQLIYKPGRLHSLSLIIGLSLVALVITAAILIGAFLNTNRWQVEGSRLYAYGQMRASASNLWMMVGVGGVCLVAAAVSAPLVPIALVIAAGVWARRRLLSYLRLGISCAVISAIAFAAATTCAALGVPATPAQTKGPFGIWAQLAAGVAMIFALLPAACLALPWRTPRLLLDGVPDRLRQTK